MRASFLFFVITLSYTVIANPVLEKRHAYKFANCNANQQKTINGALEDMEAMAAKAVENTEAANPSAAFTAWFGDGKGQKTTNERINTRYHRLASFRSSVPIHDVTFDCDASAKCCSSGSGSVPACGLRPGDEVVSICTGFWNWHQKQRIYEFAPPSGPTNEQINDLYYPYASIMLHELMHSLWGSLDVVDTVKDQFGKSYLGRGYGHQVCLRYAAKDPKNARLNADTYALFAAASYFGIGNWQTDPNKLE